MHRTVEREESAAAAGGVDNRLIFEAIALRKCLHVVYNRAQVTLAPHILYTKHGELFIDAVTIERDGKPPKEIKLGTFKLAGLKQAQLTDRIFTPEPLPDLADPKYAGVTLFTVEA